MSECSHLPIAVTEAALAAARELYEMCPFWAAADRGLDALSAALPGFSLGVSMIKVAAVNALYFAGLRAPQVMAQHVADVMAEPPEDRAELVRRIAFVCYPSGRIVRHWSFASKFCHFFVSPARFAIYDGFAAQALELHLGRRLRFSQDDLYREFVDAVDELIRISGMSVSYRDLDRYLWAAGQYWSWKTRGEATSSELVRLFESAEPSVKRLVKALASCVEKLPGGE